MSPCPRLLVFFAILATGAQAQWLNYAPPGTPRNRDGKLNLKAPAPRTADGKPDLTGVWMHEITPVAEVKRLFGNRFDAEIELAPPGMEIGTQHKYAFDILIDFKGSESPLKPETAKRLRERRPNPAGVCMGVGGFPRTGLLSEPIKIIQAPRITVILMKRDTCAARSSPTAARCPRCSTCPNTWAIRLAAGKATHSWWRRRASTARQRSTAWDVP